MCVHATICHKLKMDEKRKPHAMMIPIPFQGHINPFITLALNLASKGFSVTFITLEFVQHMLSKSTHVDLFYEARKLGLDINCTTISDGFPLEFDRHVNLIDFSNFMHQLFPACVDELVAKIIVGSSPDLAHFLVADTLYPWAAEIANKHNVAYVSCWTEPALVFSLNYHLELLRQNAHFPCKDGIEEEVNYIPGIESINTGDFMPYLKESDITAQKLVLSAFKEVKKADFILHNTVHEFESKTLSALNNYQPNYAIGPVNFLQTNYTTINKSLWSESDCAHWLHSKPPASVLYVSFGSLVQTSKQVIEEIARGLVISEVNFIWVVRPGSSIANIFPDGFDDEMKDKGFIIPWCNQVKVLSDPAVGGFLTHCGWNSVLESIWCGVPMICYPINYDQPINRKLVVDDWKIGINLCDGSLVDRKEVGEKIKELMNRCFEQDMERVRVKLQNAVEIDGSSERNFDQFVKDLKKKIL